APSSARSSTANRTTFPRSSTRARRRRGKRALLLRQRLSRVGYRRGRERDGSRLGLRGLRHGRHLAAEGGLLGAREGAREAEHLRAVLGLAVEGLRDRGAAAEALAERDRHLAGDVQHTALPPRERLRRLGPRQSRE